MPPKYVPWKYANMRRSSRSRGGSSDLTWQFISLGFHLFVLLAVISIIVAAIVGLAFVFVAVVVSVGVVLIVVNIIQKTVERYGTGAGVVVTMAIIVGLLLTGYLFTSFWESTAGGAPSDPGLASGVPTQFIPALVLLALIPVSGILLFAGSVVVGIVLMFKETLGWRRTVILFSTLSVLAILVFGLSELISGIDAINAGTGPPLPTLAPTAQPAPLQ